MYILCAVEKKKKCSVKIKFTLQIQSLLLVEIYLLPVGLSVLPVGRGISVLPIGIYLVQVRKSMLPVGLSLLPFRDISVTSRDICVTSRDVCVTSRDIYVTSREIFVTSRDICLGCNPATREGLLGYPWPWRQGPCWLPSTAGPPAWRHPVRILVYTRKLLPSHPRAASCFLADCSPVQFVLLQVGLLLSEGRQVVSVHVATETTV